MYAQLLRAMLSQDFACLAATWSRPHTNNAHAKETHSEVENTLHSLLIKGMQIK